jgi:heptosyltransferase II
VVLPSPMGDMILAGPALRHLRNALPQTHITFLGNSVGATLLAGNCWSDDWINFDKHRDSMASMSRRLRSEHFDAAVLLSNSFRSAMLVFRAGIKQRIGYSRDGRSLLLTAAVPPFRLNGCYTPIAMTQYYCYLAGQAIKLLSENTGEKQSAPDESLELFVTEIDRQHIDQLLARWGLTQNRLVVIVPGGAFGGSKWWPVERFAELADRLTNDGYSVIVSCAPNDLERDIASRLMAAAKCKLYNLLDAAVDLGALKELIRRCSLMVANDTGPCHIAAAFNVPLVTIFGPTDPRWTATGFQRETRLRVNVDCSPCQQEICRQDHRCINSITVDTVYQAARKQMAAPDGLAADADVFGSYYQVFDESFVPLSDGSGLVHVSYKKLLEQAGLATLSEIFDYQQGLQLHKPGLGSRQRLRIELPGEDENVVIYLKRFSETNDGIKDFASAVALAQKGISVPRPIAYGLQPKGSADKRSFAIIEGLPKAEALERLLPRIEDRQKEYVLLHDRKKLIQQVAQLVRQLHTAGFCHRDLYLAHIFLCRDKNNHERLVLIDLQRVFRPLLRKRRWQIKDLAQLYYSSRRYCSRTDLMRFLREYLQIGRLAPSHSRLARAISIKAKRIACHDRKKQLRIAPQSIS